MGVSLVVSLAAYRNRVGRNRRQPYCAVCAGYRRNTLSLLRPTGRTPHHAGQNPREAGTPCRIGRKRQAPRTLRLNAHDNLIVAIDPVGLRRHRAGREAATRAHARAQDGGRSRSPRASPSSSSARSSALPPRTSRPAPRPYAQLLVRRPSSATMRSRRTARTSRCCRPRRAPPSKATAAPTARPARATTSACSPA